MREPDMSCTEIRIHVQCRAILFERLIVVPRKVKHARQICSNDDRKRIDGQRPRFFMKCFRMPLEHAEKCAAPVIGFYATRIEIDSSLEFFFSPRPIPLEIAL